MINKDLVKFRFKKSIATYDNSAVIQKEMAHRLVGKVLEYCGNNFDKVFEFGVGTGFLSKSILNEINFEEYYANDIIEESEFCIRNIIKDVKFLPGDIEKINIKENFDLVLSNAVMQWIYDTDELLLKIKNNMNSGGYFAFTTFGERNFEEIKQTTGVALNYLKTETLKEKCSHFFYFFNYEENLETLYFDTPLDVLKHIKYSGTNSIKTLNWTISKLKTFEEYYRKNFSSGTKVALTYNPIYVVLKLNQLNDLNLL